MAEAGAARDADLATLVRDARERAGLTQRDVARQAGIGAGTVALAEAGGDVRHSTLAGLRRVLPSLDARRLVLGSAAMPAPASHATWRLYAEMQGMRVRRVTQVLEVDAKGPRRAETITEGLRPSGGLPEDASALLPILRTVHRGDPRLLAAILPARVESETTLAWSEDDAAHELRFPADAARSGLTYRRVELIASPALHGPRSVAHAPGLAVDELVLVARFAGLVPGASRVVARPSAVGGGERGEGAAADVPLAWDASSGELRAVIARPLPFLSHELWWQAEGAPPEPSSGKRRSGVPVLLREARLRAGLSQRALAGRVRTGVATISGAESGLDVRRSTLRALLRELPDLHAEELIPEAARQRAALASEAWELQRALHGLEADEERKVVEIDAEGDASATYLTLGLRRIRAASEPLVIRYGSSALAEGETPRPASLRLLDAPPAQDDAFLTRLTRLGDGRLVHQLSFSAEHARAGVSYERRVPLGRAFALRGDQPGLRRDEQGRAIEGTTFATAFSARRLVVEVALPAHVPPAGVAATAWPPLSPSSRADLLQRLHPRGVTLDADRSRSRMRLEVLEPLVGMRYVITWRLPG